MTGFQQIAGKGEWQTATLERSTDNLATLIDGAAASRRRGHQPDVFCPEFVVIPPQIVLISSTGKELIPRLPVGACGDADSQVLSTLAAMTLAAGLGPADQQDRPAAARRPSPAPPSARARPRCCAPAPSPGLRTVRPRSDRPASIAADAAAALVVVMLTFMAVRAVIFDWGGTLTPWDGG